MHKRRKPRTRSSASAKHGQRDQSVSISVIIPTARRLNPKRGNVAQLVAPLLAHLPIKEIVVVGQWDRPFLNGPPLPGVDLRAYRSTTTERCCLRNQAARHAVGSHLLMLDDDTIVVPTKALARQVRRLPRGSLLTMARRLYLNMAADFGTIYGSFAAQKWRLRGLKSVLRDAESWREIELYTSEITYASNFGIIDRDCG